MAHVAPYKKQLVETLATRCAQARVVGIANIHGIPAPQFQDIRKKLSGRATITVAKNNLLRLALQQASEKKPALVQLSETIQGQTAVVTADINPFRLFKELEATKTRAPARGGEVAPEDLWVRAGETPFKPGPVVGELQKAGIPAAIERGKVVIRQDKLMVKAGQRIPRDVAQQLARLEIFPLVVGLDLQGAYEEGTVFRRDVLAVDDTVVRGQIAQAWREALALALGIAYRTKVLTAAGVKVDETRVKALTAALEGVNIDEALKAAVAMPTAAPAAAPPAEKKEEKKKEEKKEEEKVSEEEAAAGLGALFG